MFADGGLRLTVGETRFGTRWSSTGTLERGDYVRAYFDDPDGEPLAVELMARAGERASLASAEPDMRFETTLDDFRARFH